MEVGVIVPNAGPKASPENIVAVARLADELGYHSIWLTDHVVLPERVDAHYPYRSHGRWDYPADTKWLDPLLSLCWAAAACPGLKIGTSILVAPLRHPVLLAKQLSTLDFLTGGRLVLGIGVGWMEEEFEAIGQSYTGRGRRTEEMIDLNIAVDGSFVPSGRSATNAGDTRELGIRVFDIFVAKQGVTR